MLTILTGKYQRKSLTTNASEQSYDSMLADVGQSRG